MLSLERGVSLTKSYIIVFRVTLLIYGPLVSSPIASDCRLELISMITRCIKYFGHSFGCVVVEI